MLTKLFSALLVSLIGAGTVLFGFQDHVQNNVTTFMQRKLDDSREIVSGLAREDYNLISKSAQDLMLLSHESAWNVFQSDEYLRMSRSFRGSAERLRNTANQKNLDGATLAYFEVTLNCVRCHKYVRQNIQDLKAK